MVADNLHISVVTSLVAVTFGVWLYQIAVRFHRILPWHADIWKSLALGFLFISWMPTANCAWITDIRFQELERKVALDASDLASGDVATETELASNESRTPIPAEGQGGARSEQGRVSVHRAF